MMENVNVKNQSGFTLIELMIVVAIVGILSAIALPAYQDYIYRARVTEALLSLSSIKATIAENGAAGLAPNAGLTAAELADRQTPGFSIPAVNAANGVITVTSALAGVNGTPADAATLTVSLTPSCVQIANGVFTVLAVNAPCLGPIAWQCGSAGKAAVAGTATIAPYAAGTATMPSKYTPSSCR